MKIKAGMESVYAVCAAPVGSTARIPAYEQ